ncbi:MAG: hypothetical protein A2W03_12760 [Candidatus Aminicenantes bacterium RBG_16_63_16]|nr:MAG: hypothetical protein A2W03_12760 [Candidatus Aminicenantes bacterium RBG_16_63_16]
MGGKPWRVYVNEVVYEVLRALPAEGEYIFEGLASKSGHVAELRRQQSRTGWRPTILDKSGENADNGAN